MSGPVRALPRDRVWIIDGNNVFGSRPDGWWRDRAAAAGRLAGEVAAWCRTHDERVILVFDGRPVAEVTQAAATAGDRLDVAFAGRGARASADDYIVALVEAHRPDGALTVVSADRGLIDRLPPEVAVEGPARFLNRLAAGSPRSPA